MCLSKTYTCMYTHTYAYIDVQFMIIHWAENLCFGHFFVCMLHIKLKSWKTSIYMELLLIVHSLTITSSACRTRSATFASNSAFKHLKAENNNCDRLKIVTQK